MQGRQCHLDLRANGTFTAADFPDMNREGIENPDPSFTSFISLSGRWEIELVGSFGPNSKQMWGIYLGPKLSNASFIGQTAPYGLRFVDGDPDEHKVLRFEKRKDSPGPQ